MGVGVEITRTVATREGSRYRITLPVNNGGYHTITTIVTSEPTVVDAWLSSTHKQNRIPPRRLVIGLGVQWTPFYHHHRHHSAATIQICVGKRCLIFHLTHANYCPHSLRTFLSDPSFTFVGLWNSQDSAKLTQSRHQLELFNGMPIDLRYHLEGMRGWSIGDIAEEFLGIDIEWSKEVSASNWDVYDLSLGQIQQAAVKAFVSFAIGVRISAWKFNTSTEEDWRIFVWGS